MRSLITFLLLSGYYCAFAQSKDYNLNFKSIPAKWDEAIPIGNGWLGALIWQKNDKLRLSIDRVDLWDDRPTPMIDQLRFNFVKEQVAKNDYSPVQRMGDSPYESASAPSKIPGAAIEFDISKLGRVSKVTLNIKQAVSKISFESGVSFSSFVHANKQAGFFFFDGVKQQNIIPDLIEPAYHAEKIDNADDMSGNSLTKLGYSKGTIVRKPGLIIYHQPTYNDDYYDVLVQWKRTGRRIKGRWTITKGHPAKPVIFSMNQIKSHLQWWRDYWSRSSLNLPDTMLDRQYQLDMYKFGCVTRSDTPPISLQAIWTADNGSLPPWKGDYHFDLNVQMSYWPGYTANHLDLTASLTNWLWKVKVENQRWTKSYFEVEGLNVPGVTTISGKPMGGWIQYSMSPTTSSWLAHHFYLQWKYSMDNHFLNERCYPYLTDVKTYLDQVMIKDALTGKFKLPLSSSPEVHENSLQAWFHFTTNYDLSLIHNLLRKYAEVAKASGNPSSKISAREKMIVPLDYNQNGLTIAPGNDLTFSHRHMSHLMAIYPLASLNRNDLQDRRIMSNSMHTLEKLGTRQWLGFSFTWAAALYAQMGEGDSALVNLRKFAQNFCSTNSFNLNGDQKGGQYSDYTYRPFTLETNFGFAEGVHQLLLQSEHGYIEVFPAVPKNWKNVSFRHLRAQGAFLISANRENGVNKQVVVFSEKGGLCRLKVPFNTFIVSGVSARAIRKEKGVLEFLTKRGQSIVLKNRAGL